MGAEEERCESVREARKLLGAGAACEQRGCYVVTHQSVEGGALFIAW